MSRIGTRMRPAVALAAVLLAVSGCAATPQPAPDPVPPRPTASAGSAEALALAEFDTAVLSALEADPDAGGRAITTALMEAGFERERMEVTPDRTTVDNPVPSVQFAVRWKDRCLLGQSGERAGGYRSAVVDPVQGRCLLGSTREITW